MASEVQAPKRERGERRRALIVEAATEMFLERGFGGTSLDDVVKRAGGSRRDIYAWFGNKEALFAAVIASTCEEILQALGAPGLPDEEPREALIRFGVLFVEILTRPRTIALYRVVVGESARFPELGRAFYEAAPAQAYARLAEDLRRWSEKGRLSVSDPDRTAPLILEMMKSDLQFRSLFDDTVRPTTTEIHRSVTVAVDIVMDGLGVSSSSSDVSRKA